LVCGDPPVCPTPAGGFNALDHFTIDLSGLDACGGASIQNGTTTPYATSDPMCFASSTGNVIKWERSVDSGECRLFFLVLEGTVASGSVQAGTEAGNACPLTNVRGPVCP